MEKKINPFKVGDKVVFARLNAEVKWSIGWAKENKMKRGRIYTVKEICMGDGGVFLEEVKYGVHFSHFDRPRKRKSLLRH